jgi:hypothetical protein
MRATVALSIRQPWAWAILVLGKDIENRTWRTRHRGPLLIHASAGVKAADIADFIAHVEARPDLGERLEAAGGLRVDELRQQAGGIVGQVEILDCVTRSNSAWFVGPFGFTLAKAETLPFQPCKGQLGLFQPFKPARAPAPAMPDLFA